VESAVAEESRGEEGIAMKPLLVENAGLLGRPSAVAADKHPETEAIHRVV
jgi:hypothetical protein